MQWIKHSPGTQAAWVRIGTRPKCIVLLSGTPAMCTLSAIKCSSGGGKNIGSMVKTQIKEQCIGGRGKVFHFFVSGHGGGLVVSILAFYLNDPSLNPAENQSSVLYCYEKMKKGAQDGV